MVDISVSKIVKTFEEGVNILDGLTFDINEGEHVGLLGKNGAGKTTLFRLLSGEISEDEGDIVIASGKKIGLISQIPVYPDSYTGEDVLLTAQRDIFDIKARMTQLEVLMSEGGSDAYLREYDALAAEFDRLGGYDADYERNLVVNGLEIPQEQRTQLFSTLSGGEKTRLNLARLILEKTDILLLDEPTNHLDMRATEWLEDYIKKFKGTVLVISHDRYFLDETVTRSIEISDGKAEFYGGNYSFYVEEKERRYQEQLKKYEAEQAEAKRLQEAADRLYQWGTGNKRLMRKSFAIESRIERVLQTDRPKKERALRARFGEKEFHGDEVLVLKGVSKAFEGRTLFSGVDLEIKGGERIALIGDNGTGKSTLIKIIMGELSPDTGVVKRGPSVKTAYLPQIIKFNNPNRSILDMMIYEENCSPQTARNRLGAFKFHGEDVHKCVRDLSGGEQSRLRMCILMRDDINFLILDEPTNHLDIASREWIEDAVSDYEGTLLFVSHDRYFINKFATRVLTLSGGVLTDFKGTFEQYRSREAMLKTAPSPKKEREHKERPKRPPSAEKQLTKVEREISRLEAEKSRIESEREEHATDYERLMQLDSELAQVESELETQMDRWTELSELIESIE